MYFNYPSSKRMQIENREEQESKCGIKFIIQIQFQTMPNPNATDYFTDPLFLLCFFSLSLDPLWIFLFVVKGAISKHNP